MVLYKISSYLNQKNTGFFIFDEEWDNLIILDACRYDIFAKYLNNDEINGTLKKKKSRGSHTTTFLGENFRKKYYDDIVYITANPYVDKLISDKVYKIISVWKFGWSKKFHTVLPETMYEYTLDTLNNYPKKKVIIHFIQPHYPYIGHNIGVEAFEKLKNLSNNKKKRKNKVSFRLFSFFGLDFYSKIDRKTHFRLYENNFKYVMSYVKKLINTLPGKTIITSDHGEALGDFLHPLIPIRLYGHSKNFRVPVLVNVPWFIINEEEKDSKALNELEERKRINESIKDLKI